MEGLNAFRDAAFWWVGNWALFTALDAGIIAVIVRIRRPKTIETLRQIEREFTENLARAMAGVNQTQSESKSGTQSAAQEEPKKGSRK